MGILGVDMKTYVRMAGILLVVLASGTALAQETPAESPKASRLDMTNLFGEGSFLLSAGMAEQALGKFTEALKTDPGETTVLYFSALALAQLGKKEEAIGTLKKVVESGEVANFWSVETEPGFASIREEPACKDLFKNRMKLVKGANAAREKRIQSLGGASWTILKMQKLPVWVVSNAEPAVRDPIADLLRRMAEGLLRDLFKTKPEAVVLVFLPVRSDDQIRDFGPAWGPNPGFLPLKSALTVETGSDQGNLTREFTHALHAADMEAARQLHPRWVYEGLARLYEDVRFEEKSGGLLGAMNPKLNGDFQEVMAKQPERCIPWKTLVDPASKTFGDRQTQMMSLVTVKYMFTYLQEKGALELYYRTLRKKFKDDPTGVKALEETLGKTFDETEADWKAWVQGLKKE
jgi:hypothetical protein